MTSLHEFLTTLRYRWWLIGAMMFVGAGLGVIIVKREIPVYVAAALIRLVDERSVVTGSLGDPAVSGNYAKTSEWMLSQLLVLQSRGVAGMVVDAEGMRLVSATPEFAIGRIDQVFVDSPPESADSVLLTFREDDVRATRNGMITSAGYGEPVILGDIRFVVRSRPPIEEAWLHILPREVAIDAMAPGFNAWVRSGTDAMELRYTSPDRRIAVRLVNAYVHAFRAENARSMQDQTTRRREFLESQLDQNELELRQAQQALIDFRTERRMYSSAERITSEQNALAQLDTRREELDSDRRLFQRMLTRALSVEGDERRRLMDALVAAPGLGESPQIGQLRNEVLTRRATLANLRSEMTELHPEVKREQFLLDEAESRLVIGVEMHIATLEARVSALDDLHDRTAARLEPLPAAEAQELRLMQDVETARTMGDQLRAEYQRVRTTEAVAAGQVNIVNLAARATTANRHPYIKLGIGAGIGLIFGIGFSLLLDALNRSVRRQTELPRLLHVPELGVIPRADAHGQFRLGRPLLSNGRSGRNGNGSNGNGPPANGRSSALVTMARMNSVGSEAYRTLRTTLMFAESIKDVKSVVVTSACIGDGKTTVVANLAISFANQGLRVLLIDADLRRPRMHDLFDLPREPGLTDLLNLAPGASEAVRKTAVPNLDLITSGTIPPNPAELVGGKRMRTLLETLKSGYDLILLDAPPVMGAADPIVVSALVDGVLFLVRAGHTGRDAAQRAVEQLERVGANVIGAVLNDPDAVAARYGRPYGYAYATDD